ncbi:unnamed protein product [Allacma fusca]|uniref:Uncharacterized protein n=1 Tax=Allacma fusca TaxID=39272 RepID=A0A8J2P410_9HEXA|nr:unnamed protein product [Allacma fusca]
MFREVKIPHVCQLCNQVIPDFGESTSEGEAGTTAKHETPEPIAHSSGAGPTGRIPSPVSHKVKELNQPSDDDALDDP